MAAFDSHDYWEGIGRGELLLQRCTQCGQVRHYPRVLCRSCFSAAVDIIPSTGHGTVHSWTVTHHVFDPRYGHDVPYTLVTVDLAEGVRAMGRFPASGQLHLGAAVTLTFASGPEGTPIPLFVPDHSAGRSAPMTTGDLG